MDIYHYHPVTGEFLGKGKADPDPKDPENWLVPAHATTIAPEQSPGDGETLVFVGGHWVKEPDYRGETWYDADGKATEIDFIGAPAEKGLSPWTPPETDEQKTTRRLVKIDAELAAIDVASVRPLRAVAAGTATSDDTAKLADLDAQAAILRTERANLI